MELNKRETSKKAGEITGYLIIFFIFSTILYFILHFLGKLPESWNYFNVLGLTLLIIFIGKLLQKILR